MKTKILCIDDDSSFRRVLELRLKAVVPELAFTQFESVASAREFLQREGAASFDLVLLDEHLGDGRGADLINEGWFSDLAVLSVSSDDGPSIPGDVMRAGASFFLNKSRISEPLFKPLILGLIDRNRIQRDLLKAREESLRMEIVRTLVSTLRHEINNPLGAVLGAAYLMKSNAAATPDQVRAAELAEQSGLRIKQVLDQLVKAITVEAVVKSSQVVFQVPGDKPWES